MEVTGKLHETVAFLKSKERWYPLGGWMGSRDVLDFWGGKITLGLPRFEARIVHPVASPYIDYANLAS